MSATAPARAGRGNASAPNHRGRTGFWQATGIVAQREVVTRLRSKSFIISTAIMLALIVGGIIFSAIGPALFDEDTVVATVAAVAPALQGLDGLDIDMLSTADAVRQAVQSGTADAGVVPGSGPSGLLVLADREAPSSTVTSPVMMLIMIPYFAVIIFNNNPLALQIMSYVPLSAPVAVPMRVYLQSQAWWEPFLSLAILAAFTVVVIAFAAKVYERSLLKTGSMVKWKDALKG